MRMGIENTTNQLIDYQTALASLIDKHAPMEGKQPTLLPNLQLLRASNVSERLHSIYKPSLIMIAQGAKIVTLGDDVYTYDATSYLVTSVHLPIVGQIVEATPKTPYLCVQINFTIEQIIGVITETEQRWTDATDLGRGLAVNRTSATLIDAVLRYVRLLDTPEDIRVMAPLMIKEILYRIIQEDKTNLFKQFALSGSHIHAIGNIIKLIHDDYSKPLRIENLATIANMSTSSLHSLFKRVTAMTPLQYQKMIRLQEARRLLLTDAYKTAADVGYLVGYESPSQFSREYARMFGLPPMKDIRQLKDSLSLNLTLI